MAEVAATPAPVSKGRTFFRRLLSSVILWAVVISSLFANNAYADYLFVIIMMVLAGLGLHEFYTMVQKKGHQPFMRLGIVAGIVLMAATFINVSGLWGPVSSPARVNDFETSVIILFVLGLCVRQFVSKTSKSGMEAMGLTLLGLMYVPWLLNFIQKINFFPGVQGNFYVLYFILVTKFSDLGAYVTGSLIGKHKMIPRISPGKTWEGFGGAIVISTAASLGFYYLAGKNLAGMTPTHAVILGIVLSVAAVVGDLIESIFKRESGVKDSGTFFPGIGGILDLLDSLLFNAPIMYLYLRHVLT